VIEKQMNKVVDVQTPNQCTVNFNQNSPSQKGCPTKF